MSDRQDKPGFWEYPAFLPEDDIVWLIVNVALMPLWIMVTKPAVLLLYLSVSLLVNLFLSLLGLSPVLSGFILTYLAFLGLIIHLAYVKPLRDRH